VLATELVLGLAPRLLAEGRWQTLQNRIAAFPATMSRGGLGCSTGWARRQMATTPTQRVQRSAPTKVSPEQNAVGQMLAAATVIDSFRPLVGLHVPRPVDRGTGRAAGERWRSRWGTEIRGFPIWYRR
jgi:hypothetical protein